MSKINVRQIRLGPEVPLRRRGCEVEEFINVETSNFWDDTIFKDAPIGNADFLQFIKEYGQEIFNVIKKLKQNEESFTPTHKEVLYKLEEYKIVEKTLTNAYSLLKNPDNFGSEFECFTSLVLTELSIQNQREVKVKYPYKKPNDYDPDGQKYDILAGLDLTRLLWIECKKPLYSKDSKDPLQNIISKDYIEKFYKRAHLLRPDIAVYLVDTKEDYSSKLKNVFTNEFINSGCYFELPSPSDTIIARLHGFIYFSRIDYSNSKDYYKGLKQSICQVLHDARKRNPELGYSGKVFKDEF